MGSLLVFLLQVRMNWQRRANSTLPTGSELKPQYLMQFSAILRVPPRVCEYVVVKIIVDNHEMIFKYL